MVIVFMNSVVAAYFHIEFFDRKSKIDRKIYFVELVSAVNLAAHV